MGAKKWARNQFHVVHLTLQHEDASDFYLCCWLGNRASLPLLCIRVILLFVCVVSMIWSFINAIRQGYIAFWFIYFTNWAVVVNVIVTGLATAVSAVAYFRGPIDSTFGLPWYVRLYYGVYCTALPCAFFVTIFYYSFITDSDSEDYEVHKGIDLLVPAINCGVLFILMVTSKQPLYLAQVVFPSGILIVYMIFSIIYYFAGGTDPLGQSPIYPMLDWSNPGPTVGVVFGCLALTLVTTTVAVTLTLVRDYFCHRLNSYTSYDITG